MIDPGEYVCKAHEGLDCDAQRTVAFVDPETGNAVILDPPSARAIARRLLYVADWAEGRED